MSDEFSNIGDATHVDETGDLYCQKTNNPNDNALAWTVTRYWGTSIFKNFELDKMERFTKIEKPQT